MEGPATVGELAKRFQGLVGSVRTVEIQKHKRGAVGDVNVVRSRQLGLESKTVSKEGEGTPRHGDVSLAPPFPSWGKGQKRLLRRAPPPAAQRRGQRLRA